MVSARSVPISYAKDAIDHSGGCDYHPGGKPAGGVLTTEGEGTRGLENSRSFSVAETLEGLYCDDVEKDHLVDFKSSPIHLDQG